jgi:hypothetical protein
MKKITQKIGKKITKFNKKLVLALAILAITVLSVWAGNIVVQDGSLEATGLNQNLFTGVVKFLDMIDMSSNRITNLAAPTAGTDAVNKDYVDALGGAGGGAVKVQKGKAEITIVAPSPAPFTKEAAPSDIYYYDINIPEAVDDMDNSVIDISLVVVDGNSHWGGGAGHQYWIGEFVDADTIRFRTNYLDTDAPDLNDKVEIHWTVYEFGSVDALGGGSGGSGGACFEYYCNDAGNNACTDSGDPDQGYCPAGFEQIQDLGDWGYCYDGISDNAAHSTFRPPNGNCLGYNNPATEGILGQAYLCCDPTVGSSGGGLGASVQRGTVDISTTTRGAYTSDVSISSVDLSRSSASVELICDDANPAVGCGRIIEGGKSVEFLDQDTIRISVYADIETWADNVPGTIKAHWEVIEFGSVDALGGSTPGSGAVLSSDMAEDVIPDRSYPYDYTEICFKNDATFYDLHAGGEATTGGNCDPGDRGYVIEQDQRDAAASHEWSDSHYSCAGSGMRLPTIEEMTYACNMAAQTSFVGDPTEWVHFLNDDIVDFFYKPARTSGCDQFGYTHYVGRSGFGIASAKFRCADSEKVPIIDIVTSSGTNAPNGRSIPDEISASSPANMRYGAAFKYCLDLNEGGNTDWYLPTPSELVFFTNDPALPDADRWFWADDEGFYSSQKTVIKLSDGSHNNYYTTGTNPNMAYARCIRYS